MSERIKHILCHEWTIGLVALIGILVWVNTADADWLTVEDDTVGTVAILHGTVAEKDIEIPEADHYHINSGGGQVYAGKKIAEAILKTEKTVTFDQAYSIAGYIALKTKAMPRGKAPKMGFHWSASPFLTEEELEPINAMMTMTILEHVRIKHATKIIAAMDKLWGHDQANSMVLWHLDTNKIEIILDGKSQDKKTTTWNPKTMEGNPLGS